MRAELPNHFDRAAFDAIHWHQGWEVFPGLVTPGRSVVSEILKWCGVPERLDGRRVLDVGAWNGCASFECERRGAAEVVALSLEKPEWTGFNILKEALGADRTRYVRGTIYNLDPRELGTFDVVLCFGVLYHLRYMVLGIDNLRRVCRGDLFLETHILDHGAIAQDGSETSLAPNVAEMRLLQFHDRDQLHGDISNWIAPSASALRAIVETAGFAFTHSLISGNRGYFSASATVGLPPFVTQSLDARTYEGHLYDAALEPLFGPLDQWKR